jgi:hypothetical protein
MRQVTEAEARAGMTVLMLTTQHARRTIASWAWRDHRPTKDELTELEMWLKEAEDRILNLSAGPITDGHELDTLIDKLIADLAELPRTEGGHLSE